MGSKLAGLYQGLSNVAAAATRVQQEKALKAERDAEKKQALSMFFAQQGIPMQTQDFSRPEGVQGPPAQKPGYGGGQDFMEKPVQREATLPELLGRLTGKVQSDERYKRGREADSDSFNEWAKRMDIDNMSTDNDLAERRLGAETDQKEKAAAALLGWNRILESGRNKRSAATEAGLMARFNKGQASSKSDPFTKSLAEQQELFAATGQIPLLASDVLKDKNAFIAESTAKFQYSGMDDEEAVVAAEKDWLVASHDRLKELIVKHLAAKNIKASPIQIDSYAKAILSSSATGPIK